MNDKVEVDEESRKGLGAITYAQAEATFYTGKASDIARALALTDIAVVWFFAAGGIEHITPKQTVENLQSNCALTWALYMGIMCVVLDLLQYLWGAGVWMLARWSIQEALIRDVGATPSRVSAIIWRIGRLVGVPKLLAEMADVSWVSAGSWVVRRDNLRETIKAHRDAKTLDSTFDSAEGPQWLNAPIALIFWAKCVSVISSYVLLGYAIA